MSSLISQPEPKLIPAAHVCITESDYVHYYICDAGLHPTVHVPGIPKPYEHDALSGRALYVRGIPEDVGPRTMASLFREFGLIGDICVVDELSQAVFRWVVLDSDDGFRRAMSVFKQCKPVTLNWADHGLLSLVVCPALKAGRTFMMDRERKWTVDGVCRLLWTNHKLGLGDIESMPSSTLVDFDRTLLQSPRVHLPPVVPKISISGPAAELKQSNSDAATSSVFHKDHLRGQEAPAEKLDYKDQEIAQHDVGPSATSQHTDNEFVPMAASWAKMAGEALGKSDEKVIDLHPKTKAVAPRLVPVGRIPSLNGRTKTSSQQETANMQKRLIFLFHLPNNITLTDISDAIHEGPLVAIRLSHDAETGKRFAGVIFHAARHAEDFYKVLRQEKIESRPGRFRFIVDAEISPDNIPVDDVIRKMGPPDFATRRLTIVKKGFFFVMREPHLHAFCEKHVAKEDIQYIWLYNGGNATVIFAKVEDAIKVKAALDHERDRAEETSHWYGLQTSYSKDPCVAQIRFETDLHD